MKLTVVCDLFASFMSLWIYLIVCSSRVCLILKHRSSLCLDFKSGLLSSQVFYHNLGNKYEKIYQLELRDKSQMPCPVILNYLSWNISDQLILLHAHPHVVYCTCTPSCRILHMYILMSYTAHVHPHVVYCTCTPSCRILLMHTLRSYTAHVHPHVVYCTCTS